MHNIQISASDVSGDAWRMIRVSRIHHIVNILNSGSSQFETAILSLHDHEGNLVVTWAKEPTAFDKERIEKIWSLEGEPSVWHELATKEELETLFVRNG